MFDVLHQHTHTNQAPDPAVGLEPRADKDGPATPLTTTRWDRVWCWVPPPLIGGRGAHMPISADHHLMVECGQVCTRGGAARVVD